MERNITDLFRKEENKSLGNQMSQIAEFEWTQPLSWFLLIAFLSSEIGNIALVISLCKKQVDNCIAVFIKGMIASDMLAGMFVLLPRFGALTDGGWFLVKNACVFQAVMGNITSLTSSAIMFYLAYERYSVVVNKKDPSDDTTVAKLLVFGTFVISAIIASLTLTSMEEFQFIEGLYECKLQTEPFSTLYDIGTRTIPALSVLILTLVTLLKLHGYCSSNKIMDIDMTATTPVGQSPVIMDRSLLTRGSLFPRFTEGNMAYTHSGVTLSQSKATVAIAYFNVPLAFLSIVSSGFSFVAYNFYLGDTRILLLTISMLWSVLANMIRPFILLSVSSTLRKAFLNFLRRRTTNPTFRIIGGSPQAIPREDVFGGNELPEFLRPTSSMRIRLQVLSSVDLKDQCREETNNEGGMSLGSTTSLGGNYGSRNNFRHDERRSSWHTNTDSLDSVFVRAGTSIDAPNRWSLSTGSVMTLDLPDFPQVLSRPRSCITRTVSDNQEHLRYGRNSVTSPSPNVETNRRRQTLPSSISVNNVTAITPTTPHQITRKRMPNKMFGNCSLLPTVQDLGSKECSPKTSSQMSQRSTKCSLDNNISQIINPRLSGGATTTIIPKLEIIDLTEIEGQIDQDSSYI